MRYENLIEKVEADPTRLGAFRVILDTKEYHDLLSVPFGSPITKESSRSKDGYSFIGYYFGIRVYYDIYR